MLTKELYQCSQEYQQSLPKLTFPAVHKCKGNPHIYMHTNHCFRAVCYVEMALTNQTFPSFLPPAQCRNLFQNSRHCKNSPSAYLHKRKKTAPWSGNKHSADCSFAFVYLHSRQEVGLVSYLLDTVLQIAYVDGFCKLPEARLKCTKGESFGYLKC